MSEVVLADLFQFVKFTMFIKSKRFIQKMVVFTFTKYH